MELVEDLATFTHHVLCLGRPAPRTLGNEEDKSAEWSAENPFYELILEQIFKGDYSTALDLLDARLRGNRPDLASMKQDEDIGMKMEALSLSKPLLSHGNE